MSDEERQALAAELERQIRPLIRKSKFDGGYDCCGCSTYDYILDHALAIVRGEAYENPNASEPDDDDG